MINLGKIEANGRFLWPTATATATTTSTDNESAAGGEEFDKGGDVGHCALRTKWSGSYRRWKALASTSTWRLGRQGWREVDQPQRWALNPAKKHPTTTTTTTITTTILFCGEGNFEFFIHFLFDNYSIYFFFFLVYSIFLPFLISVPKLESDHWLFPYICFYHKKKTLFLYLVIQIFLSVNIFFLSFFLKLTNDIFKQRLSPFKKEYLRGSKQKTIHSLTHEFTLQGTLLALHTLLSDFTHASSFTPSLLIH